MKIVNNISQKKAGVVLSYINTGLSFAIHLVYTPVMIRLLGQSEYGLYTLVASIVSYLGLFSLGFNGAYLRFYARYRNKNDFDGIASLNGLFLLVFLCMAFLAFSSGMVLSCYPREVFGEKLSVNETERATILLRILVISISLSFPNTVFQSIVTSNERFVFSRILTLLSTVLNPLICLPLLLLGYGSTGIVFTTLLISILTLVTNICYCKRKIKTRFLFSRFEKGLLKEIAFFSFFIFINMIIDQLNWQVDKYILGRTSGTNEVAIYGVGAQFNTIIIGLSTTVSNVFVPKVHIIANGDSVKRDKMLSNLLIRVGRIQFMIIIFVFFGFLAIGKPFVRWWAGNTYEKAFFVALLLIAPLVIVLPHGLGIEIRRAKNQHQKVAVIMLITTIANVIISIPLSKAFGAIGASFGTFLCLIINMIWIDRYYIRTVQLDILSLYKNMFSILIPVLPALFIALASSFIKINSLVILCTTGYVIIYIFLLYTYAMNEYEKNVSRNLIVRLQRLLKH